MDVVKNIASSGNPLGMVKEMVTSGNIPVDPVSLLTKGMQFGLKYSTNRFKKNSDTAASQKQQLRILEKELSRRRRENQRERHRQIELLARELKGEDIDPEDYASMSKADNGFDLDKMRKMAETTKRGAKDIVQDVIVNPWYGLITSVVKGKRQKKIGKMINAIDYERQYRDDPLTAMMRRGVEGMRYAKKLRKEALEKAESKGSGIRRKACSSCGGKRIRGG